MDDPELKPYESLQEVFDVAYRGLAAQGFERAMHFNKYRDRQTCAYRSESTSAKCAIGHCVPDDFITGQTRYSSVLTALKADDRWKALFANISPDVLADLQGVHDNSSEPERMKKHLHRFAQYYKLTIPAIPENTNEQ